MSKPSAQKIQAGLDKLREEFDYLSTQDQMFYKTQELQLCKLVFAMGEFPMDVVVSNAEELP